MQSNPSVQSEFELQGVPPHASWCVLVNEIKKIIHVGRISFEKNIERTIKAFSYLNKKYPNVEYEIIGDGPALESLKEYSKKIGVKVNFLGRIAYKKNSDPCHKIQKYH